MALKGVWEDKVNGKDRVKAQDVNTIAKAVMDLEEVKISVSESEPIDGSNVWIDTDEEAPSGGTLIDVVASVGQTIVVKEVDDSGKPTKWEAVDFPEDKAITLEEIDAICVIPPEVIAAGLYKNGAMVMSWDELVEDGMFNTDALSGGYLMGMYEYTPSFTDGELIVDNSVMAIGGVPNYFTKVVIPDSVTNVDGGSFDGNDKLVEVILPDTITSITAYLFSDCTSLRKVNIPSQVTEISSYAFSGCSELNNIVIPNSVTHIADYAFNNCISLNTIAFEGTISEWSAITLNYEWNHGIPATQIICSDGTVTL